MALWDPPLRFLMEIDSIKACFVISYNLFCRCRPSREHPWLPLSSASTRRTISTSLTWRESEIHYGKWVRIKRNFFWLQLLITSCIEGFTRKISYKPDIYTYLDIYKGNPWHIPPTVYSEWGNSRRSLFRFLFLCLIYIYIYSMYSNL